MVKTNFSSRDKVGISRNHIITQGTNLHSGFGFVQNEFSGLDATDRKIYGNLSNFSSGYSKSDHQKFKINFKIVSIGPITLCYVVR